MSLSETDERREANKKSSHYVEYLENSPEYLGAMLVAGIMLWLLLGAVSKAFMIWR
jgi:hypothetical protein